MNQIKPTALEAVVGSLKSYTKQLAGEYLELQLQVSEAKRTLEAYEETKKQLKVFIQRDRKALEALKNKKHPSYEKGSLGHAEVWHPVDGWQDNTPSDSPSEQVALHYGDLTDAELEVVAKSAEVLDEMLADCLEDNSPTQSEIDDYWLDQDID